MDESLTQALKHLEATRKALAKISHHRTAPATAEASLYAELETHCTSLIHYLKDLQITHDCIEHAHQEWVAALDVFKDPIFLHDKEFRILRCNRAYQQCAGLPFSQIIGQRYYDVFPKSEGPLEHCIRALEGPSDDEDTEDITVGNDIYQSRSSAVTDEQGNYHYSVHILEKITDRKHAEQMLLASRDLLQTVVENVPLRIFWKDASLHYLGCNSLFAQDAGWAIPDDVIGKDDYQMGWLEQAESYRADDAEVLKSGVAKLYYEEPQTKADGSKVWVRTSKVPLRDNNADIIGVLGLYEDITERRQKEDRLKLFHALLDNSNDAVEILDPATLRFVDINNAECSSLGYSRDELLAMTIQDIDPTFTEASNAKVEAEIRQSGTARFEGLHQRKDGSTFPVEVSVTYVELDKPYALCIVRDITERKNAEQSLRRANRALRTLSSCNAILVHATNETQLLRDMCKTIVDTGGYRLAWIGSVKHDAEKTVHPVACSGNDETYLDTLHITWADTERGQGPTGRAVRLGTPQLAQNILTDPDFGVWREQAIKRGFASSIALPLKSEDKAPFAVLNIYATEPGAFDVSEVSLLQELADDLSFGMLTLNTRLERDHFQQEHIKSATQLKEALVGTIRAIATTVEKRDPYTAGHQNRVADLAAAIGTELGLEGNRIEGLRLGATIHDIGKIYVPAEILNRPGRLSPAEFEMIKSHPEVGYEIIKDISFPWPVSDMVLQHHERLDGSGYPQGLKGDDICLEARILGVADMVEAITAHRPYRPAMGLDKALSELEALRGQAYDTDVVDACLLLFREKGFQWRT
jgi:PAS domain S-box-containing protein/putative nucleotidyltransferase with HDIG domain